MNDYTMFKKSINGFDKDEVLNYIQKEDEAHAKQIASYEKEIRRREKVIGELKNRIVMKDEEVTRLENQIREKYQKYIDHYEEIGEVLTDAKIKSGKVISDAQAKSDQILADADKEAERRVNAVQGEIDAKLADGKKKYVAVQDEMKDTVEMFNAMQRKFMQSYKEVHEIIQSMPASLNDIELLQKADVAVDDDSDDLDDDLDLDSFDIKFNDDDYDEDLDDDLDDLDHVEEKKKDDNEKKEDAKS